MMLSRLFATAAAAAFAIVARADDDKGQSVFVTEDQALAFAVTASDSGIDIAFSLRVSRSYSWGAVGIGSDDMPGALYFIIYENADRDNVTFSPRLSYKNIEPHYNDQVKWEVLEGTGLDDDYMTFTAKCTEGCRSWPSGGTSRGYVDVSSAREDAIFALGPKEGFASDDREQDLKVHSRYGGFELDFKRTQGVEDTPKLKGDVKAVGSKLRFSKSGYSDAKSIAHAVLMIIGVGALMPLGAVMLRLGMLVRWHALNQTAAMLLVLAGFGLGVATSFSYQRSRGFKHYHQILGMIVVAFILGQFSIGFLHHRKFKATQNKTIYGTVHIWLGRAIIFFGILNCFFGLTFALNRRYGMVLAGLIILILFVTFGVTIGRRWLTNKNRRQQGLAGQPGTYGTPPWRQNAPAPVNTGAFSRDAPPGYEQPSHQDRVGLRSVSPSPSSPNPPLSPWKKSERRDDDDDIPHLGATQAPREFT